MSSRVAADRSKIGARTTALETDSASSQIAPPDAGGRLHGDGDGNGAALAGVAPDGEGQLSAQRDAPLGGQAVLEGVMMRGVSNWAVAVRNSPRASARPRRPRSARSRSAPFR
jgi:hypothetical protein